MIFCGTLLSLRDMHPDAAAAWKRFVAVISPGLHEWWPFVAYLILRTPNVGFCGANSGFSSQAQDEQRLERL